jgi:hypothetical protein
MLICLIQMIMSSIAVPDVYDDDFDNDSDSETLLIKRFDNIKLKKAEHL